MEKLAKWIDGRMSRAEFARQTGMSPSHLSLMLAGERGISLETAVTIERMTEGDITAISLARNAEQA